MSEVTDWIKLNLPDLDRDEAKKLARYIKQAKIDEVEKYADHLSDQDNEAAFEMAWQPLKWRGRLGYTKEQGK